MKNYVLILVLFLVYVCGCEPESVPKRTLEKDTSSITAGIIEYLKGRNLPALKTVENWENGYGPGLIITTKHYKIHTTLLDPLMLSQVPGFIESAYKGYQKQLPQPVATTEKFTIYLFATRKQWEDFTTAFTGKQAPLYKKIKAGAYYLKGVCVAYHIGRDRTFHVLGHEGWHQFNKRHFKYRLPSWLDEGIAMAFEASRYENGIFIFDPSRNFQRLGSLKLTLSKQQMIPLKKLIAMNPGEAIISSDDAVSAFYSQAFALVRFLKEDNYGRRLGNYRQMLLGGLQGTWPLDETTRTIAIDRNIPITVSWNRFVGTKLFERYIGSDISQIESEYLTFCRKIAYHIYFKK